MNPMKWTKRLLAGSALAAASFWVAPAAMATVFTADTFDSAPVGVVANPGTLHADNDWTARGYYGNAGSGTLPQLEIQALSGGNHRLVNTAPSTNAWQADIARVGLTPFNAYANPVTVEFDITPTTTVDGSDKKWYIFLGQATGNYLYYRVRFQARTGKSVMQVSLFSGANEGGTEKKIEPVSSSPVKDHTYHMKVTFTPTGSGTTNITYHVRDLTAGTDILAEATSSLAAEIPTGTTCDMLQVTCHEQPFHAFDNLKVTYGAADVTAPGVTSVNVAAGRDVDVTFSEQMWKDMLNPANYALSGSGQGTLSATPNSVSKVGPDTYRLHWDSGAMADAGDITVTADSTLTDVAGNVLGAQNSGTDVGGAAEDPAVASANVLDTWTIDVAFSKAMGDSALTPANYVVSGVGVELTAHPDSVTRINDMTYRLSWNTGDMAQGTNVTITAHNVMDISGTPLGPENSATDIGGGIGTLTLPFNVLPLVGALLGVGSWVGARRRRTLQKRA